MTNGAYTTSFMVGETITAIIGGALWITYFFRCFDFDFAYGPGVFMHIRVMWMLSFVMASVACLSLVLLVLVFEQYCAGPNLADFHWNYGMIATTLREGLPFTIALIGSLFIVCCASLCIRVNAVKDKEC